MVNIFFQILQKKGEMRIMKFQKLLMVVEAGWVLHYALDFCVYFEIFKIKNFKCFNVVMILPS